MGAGVGAGAGARTTATAPYLSPAAIGLTTLPGVKPGAQTILLTNAGTATYNWTLGKEPSWVTINSSSGSIPPGGTSTLTAYLWYNQTFPNAALTYTGTVTINNPDGIYHALSLPVTVTAASAATRWYFAEGYTGGSFTEYLTLANPGQTNANVTVQYLLGSGGPISKSYVVNANTRSTITVNREVGSGQSVSMVVTSDQPIVAERPMYFTYTSLPGYTIPGGTDVVGATQLGTQFDFGYLDTTPGHDTWLTILNQNASAMTVSIQYFGAGGGAATSVSHTISANSRGTVHVNAEGLPAGTYSALVSLSEPGLVERPMYLQDSVTSSTGAADMVGVTQPLKNWYFAEGYTNTNFSERYFLSNPSVTTPANVVVTFYRTDGTSTNAPVTVPPGGQQVVNANNVLGAGVNNSASVASDLPILAERFMSFVYTGPVGTSTSSNIPGATDVLGAAAPSHLFEFAEGYTGGQFGEYLTIENPDPSQTAAVSVAFLPTAGGAPVTVVYSVRPSSRFTLNTNTVMVSQSFSMTVVSSLPVVAERPMYFAYNGTQTGGSDVVGYQPAAPEWNRWSCSFDDTAAACEALALASLPTARFGFASVTGPDGRIYAIGGFVSGQPSNVVEAYTPSTNSWTTLAPMPTPRADLAAAVGSDGRIYAIGGYVYGNPTAVVEAYTPATNSWSTVAPMSTAREWPAAVEGPDGRIYAMGGYDVVLNAPTPLLDSVEAYSPGSNSWTAVASLPTARSNFAAAVGLDGRIYAFGGSEPSGTTATTVAYSPTSDTWSTVASMPTPRYDLAGVVGPDGSIYAIGGMNGSTWLDVVEVYSPSTNTWIEGAAMPTARTRLAAAALPDGRIFAIGGYSGDPSKGNGTVLYTVEAYSS